MQLNKYAVDSGALKAYTSKIVEQEKCNVRKLVRFGFQSWQLASRLLIRC